MRRVAQTISYEVRLALILLSLFRFFKSPLLSIIIEKTLGTGLLLIEAPLLVLWFIACIAETNRTPFDFAEGESELVAGFNTEFGAAGFVIIFIAEYGGIIALSYYSALFLCGGQIL